jgi:hypothetical protein
MKREISEPSVDKATREDFILDTELFDYYNKKFEQSPNLNSLSKIRLMKKIHEHQQQKNLTYLFVTALSVAGIIAISSYITSEYIIESRIESNIPFVD